VSSLGLQTLEPAATPPSTAEPWPFDPRPRTPGTPGSRRTADRPDLRSSFPAVAGESLRSVVSAKRPGNTSRRRMDSMLQLASARSSSRSTTSVTRTAAPRTPRPTQHTTGHPERAPCARIVARRLPAIGPGRPPRRAPFLVRLQSPRAPPVPLDQFRGKLAVAAQLCPSDRSRAPRPNPASTKAARMRRAQV
jgi:hypothetical protein